MPVLFLNAGMYSFHHLFGVCSKICTKVRLGKVSYWTFFKFHEPGFLKHSCFLSTKILFLSQCDISLFHFKTCPAMHLIKLSYPFSKGFCKHCSFPKSGDSKEDRAFPKALQPQRLYLFTADWAFSKALRALKPITGRRHSESFPRLGGGRIFFQTSLVVFTRPVAISFGIFPLPHLFQEWVRSFWEAAWNQSCWTRLFFCVL